MIGILRKAAIAALLLAAGNAWALGLGQIKVKSKLNQPLLAEIPIISTTPGELAALRTRMASPETFRRIGLPPPTGAAADLQFSLGSDARGNPVIRVTSVQPVDQAMVNFLIEVDWGEGKLVREYSALVDAPNTASAPAAQADVQMAAVEAPNLVQRPALPEATAEAAAAPVTAEPLPPQPEARAPAAPAPVAAEAPAPEAAVDVSTPPPAAPAPEPSETAAATAEAAAADDASQYGPIKRGETLSAIAGSLGLRNTFSLDQTMLALLRANPDAFISDNINRLRQGAVLRVPEGGEVAQIDAGEAGAVVRQQMQAWRQSQRPVLQPDAVAMAGTAPANRAPAASASPPAAPAAAPSAAAARTAAAPGARRTEARLQIVPPTGTTPAAGANTGTGNRGGGSMLQQELAQRDEEISAKTAEIGELKERVAELERIRDEQHRLLTMKDTELASAQHQLAQANQAAPAAAQAPAAAHSNVNPYYIGGGVAVLLLGLLVWFLSKRNRPEPEPKPRRSFDHDALAASMQRLDQRREQKAKVDATPAPQPSAAPGTPPASAASGSEAPAWHSGWVVKGAVSRSGAQEPQAAQVSDPEPAPPTAPAAPTPAAGNEPPAHASAEQRFKLVDAFLDMGDRTSAQQLLAELLNDEDDAVSEKAGKMLARIMG